MTTTHGFPGKMLFVIGASAVLIIAVCSLEHGNNLTSYEAYAIAVGAVAATLAIVALVLLKIQPDSMKKELFSVRAVSVDTQYFLALFLCLWWLVGTTVITFKAPFTVTSNGYFAAWIGLFASAMALGDAPRPTIEKTSRGSVVCLLLSAIVVLLALAILHDTEAKRKHMQDESIFGLISACLTIFSCILLLCVPESLPKVAPKIFAVLLVLLWIATAGVLTFRSPFLVTGNGYFASWAGCLFACALFSDLVLHPAVQVEGGATQA